MQYPYPIYEYPAHIKFFTNITTLFSEPIVLFTSLTALGAIIAAIAAVYANKPNSREKTDILKCEILNVIRHPTGLETWVRLASSEDANPTSMGLLLDIERSRQIFPNILRIGILGKIFKSRKYSKYKWTVYIIAAMSELEKEGYNSVSIGMTPITQTDVRQWSYEQCVAMLSNLGIPEDEIDNYLIRS